MIRTKTHGGQSLKVSGFKDVRILGVPVAIWAATLTVLLARVLYITLWHPYGLAPDEAQYWSWLMHNDWSFLTKPPLVTWLIGVSTWVLGDTLLGVKAFALLGQGLVSVLGYLLAKEIAGERSGRWAWVLLTTVPLIAAGGLIMSPDAVLVPLWLGAMLLVAGSQVAGNQVAREADTAEWGRWIAIGVLIGLGGLAKYSAAVFYPLLGVYVLVVRRAWLLRPQVWVSGLVALVFMLPVLIWNMQNGWVGVEHLLWQADGGGDTRHGGWKSVGEYVGGQALVLGPVVFGLMVCGLMVKGLRGNAVERWLVWVAGAILGAFLVLSVFSKVQANWPVLGSVVGVVVLAVWLGRNQEPRNQGTKGWRWWHWVAVGGIVVNSVLSLMLMDTYKARDLGILPLKAKIDPTKDLRGWEEMGNLVGLMMYKLDNPIILSSRYQTLAPLMFHTIGAPEFAYINAEGKRLNQYDLWPLPDLNGRLVVYVNEQGYLPPKIKEMFGQCEPWHNLAVEEYGIQTRRMSLWLCWSARRTVALR